MEQSLHYGGKYLCILRCWLPIYRQLARLLEDISVFGIHVFIN